MSSLFRFVIVFVSVLGTSNAFAFVCSNMAGDAGYSVNFSENVLYAQVQENNIAGAKTIAELTCQETGFGSGYEGFLEIFCTENQSKGASDFYTATLRSGGLSGLPRVVLRRGDVKLATLKCNFD